MAQSVITDGDTLAYLTAKGYRFSASAEEMDVEKIFEQYDDCKINDGFAGKRWKQGFVATRGHALTDLTGETEPFAHWATFAPAAVKGAGAIANAIVTAAKGGRWAVFGHYPWNPVISSGKREQLVRVADAIGKEKLSAYVMTHRQCLIFPRTDARNRLLAASVVHTDIGHSGTIEVRIRNPISERFTLMGQSRETQKLSFRKDDDGYIVSIPDIAPWSVCTIFVAIPNAQG